MFEKLFCRNKTLIEFLSENLGLQKNCTLSRLIFYLRKFEESDMKIRKITPKWIEEFQFFLLYNANLSKGSASLYSSALRKYLHLAVRDSIISKSPADFVKNIPMPESKKLPLSLAEIKRLSRIKIPGKLGGEVKKAFLFSCCTGLRISDLRELTYSMIHAEGDKSLWVRKIQKKTGRAVAIPLSESAVRILKSIKIDFVEAGARLHESLSGSDGCYVFPLLASTKTNTDQYLKKWGEKAGIQHVSWHTARHTMATLALENGAELKTVSELLGHSQISTTLRYAKSTDKLKKAAVNSIPALPIDSGE